MTKKEVQNRVLKAGKPLSLDLFSWDEDTRTFSTTQSGLVIDFSGQPDCTFKTGGYCTFKTGYACTFYTGSVCTFKTGISCTFKTGYACTFKTGYACTFNTGDSCTFNTGDSCTFNTGDSCTFNTEGSCTFNTGYNCTFNTGCNCIFNTSCACTFTYEDGTTHNTPPLRFNGTKFSIEASGVNSIRSGCINKPTTWWLANIVRCAEEYDYTPEQVAEYEMYVKLIAEWQKSLTKKQVKND